MKPCRYYYHASLAHVLNAVAARLSRLHRLGATARRRRFGGKYNLLVGGWSNYHERQRDSFSK